MNVSSASWTREPATQTKRGANRGATLRAVAPRLVLLLVLLLPAGAQAQKDLSGDPGWVDLRALGLSSDDATLEIFLEGSLIRMVAEAVRGEDARFADLLGKLRAVRVQTFSLEGADEAATVRRGDATVRQLEERGWKPVFRVREEGERIYLYLKEDAAGVISGVFVMAAEAGDSLTLVNIVGNFDPVELGRLGASLQIDPLEMLGRMARGQAASGAKVDEPGGEPRDQPPKDQPPKDQPPRDQPPRDQPEDEP